jgi:YlmC/YmxH family sporulation protein
MKYSEFGQKEIINLSNGEKFGYVGDSELVIDEETGKIKGLIININKGQFSLFSDKDQCEIPWECIKKIGPEMLIIEMDENRLTKYR